ncbi:MAG: U32 family peptidase [Deltaproteobacteria bacterium]|jgi:putative protease|nr:U32 family peptidase [Deltaproteobacteria bacterium]
MHKPELLVPAGNLEKFRTALLYGANAVYLGGEALNLRASSAGLGKQDLIQAVQEAKALNVSIYYCLNSFPRQEDLAELPGIIEDVASCDIQAFIVADPGVIRLARRYAPDIPLHLSTQANTSNSSAVDFWLDQGVSRINLARELSCPEVESIQNDLQAADKHLELEMFVHGAMCLAISGKCLLSSWLNKRPANLGRCTQPCRFEYRALNSMTKAELIVEEALRPGEAMWRVQEGERFSSFWSPDDLCLLPYLPWFIRHKIRALKIEGRMKSAVYVAHTADVYSTALKLLTEQQTDAEQLAPEQSSFDYAPFLRELSAISVRPLSTGFFLPDKRLHIADTAIEGATLSHAGQQARILAKVLEPGQTVGSWVIDIKDNWENTTNIELVLPGMKRPVLTAKDYGLENQRGEWTGSVRNGTRATLRTDFAELRPGIFIRDALI